GSRVEVPVAGGQRRLDGERGLIGRGLKDAETDGRNRDAVVQGEFGCGRHERAPFFVPLVILLRLGTHSATADPRVDGPVRGVLAGPLSTHPADVDSEPWTPPPSSPSSSPHAGPASHPTRSAFPPTAPGG